jgi:homoserine kinase type II
MHLAGLDAVREPGRFEAEALLGRLERIAAAPDPGLAAHAEPLRRRLHEWTGKRNPTLPRGLIHGDLFRDNVLWNNDGNIAAILDFESASDGALTYDLMVTVLAWSFRDDFDEAVARGIVGGYDAIRPISDEERMGLLAEAFIVALRFSITRITDEAMRAFEAGRPLRTDKDYRRFLKRIQRLEDLGHEGLMRLLFD